MRSVFSAKAREAFTAASEFLNTASQASVDLLKPTSDQLRSFDPEIHILPTWAVKVPRGQDSTTNFDIDVPVTGFACCKAGSHSTRAQRAILSVARRFASIPMSYDPQLHIAAHDQISPSTGASLASNGSVSSASKQGSSKVMNAKLTADDLLKLRLQPFWSTPIPSASIRMSVYSAGADQAFPSTRYQSFSSTQSETEPNDQQGSPLISKLVPTDAQGLFSSRLRIPWEVLRSHPSTQPFLLDHSGVRRWTLFVVASTVLPPSPPSDYVSQPRVRSLDTANQLNAAERKSTRLSTSGALMRSSNDDPEAEDIDDYTRCLLLVDVDQADGIRIISDVDDTIKHSDVLGGFKTAFKNAFCSPSEDLCVEGMNALYRRLADTGIGGFHYISNSPLELLAPIREFLVCHDFPEGYSLNLRYYGRRSVLASLFEPAVDRKRPAILDVLTAFPHARFILFGDSGEQDLELYLSLAVERPEQILGIFIRDVTSKRVNSPQWSEAIIREFSHQSSTISENGEAGSRRDGSQSGSSLLDDINDLPSAQQRILRNAFAWQQRMSSARSKLPRGVVLRFFRDVEEIQDEAVALANA